MAGDNKRDPVPSSAAAPVPESISIIDKPDDSVLADLAAVHQAAFEAQGETGWSADSLAALATQDGVFVLLATAVDGALTGFDSVAGFALVRIVFDEAELLTFAVAPAHQRRGMARRLLHVLRQFLSQRAVDRCLLEVRHDNEAAVQLYRKFGFEQIATRKNYYNTIGGKRVDAEIFCLNL